MMYDLLKDYNLPMKGEGPFFTDYLYNLLEAGFNIGLQNVEWHDSDYPYLSAHKAKLIERFNNEYAFREIGQETTTRFQHFMQARFDEVADHFNHMYKVFETNNVDELGTGYGYTENFEQDKEGTSSGESTDTNKSEFEDTPVNTTGGINNPTNRTEDKGSNTNSSNYNDKNKYNKTIKRTEHNEHMIDELNALSDKYKSIDNDFIKAFDNMFIGIYV